MITCMCFYTHLILKCIKMLHISLSFSLSTYAYNLQPQPRPQLVDDVDHNNQGTKPTLGDPLFAWRSKRTWTKDVNGWLFPIFPIHNWDLWMFIPLKKIWYWSLMPRWRFPKSWDSHGGSPIAGWFHGNSALVTMWDWSHPAKKINSS